MKPRLTLAAVAFAAAVAALPALVAPTITYDFIGDAPRHLPEPASLALPGLVLAALGSRRTRTRTRTRTRRAR